MSDEHKTDKPGSKETRNDGYSPKLEHGYRPKSEERGYTPASASGKPTAPPLPPISGSNVAQPDNNTTVAVSTDNKE